MSSISPFTFVAWKEDVNGIIVGTEDTSIGYVELLEIDGVSAESILEYAREQKGETDWEKDLAEKFPAYVAALAEKAGKSCFVATKKAAVECADLSTGEVLELKLEASEQSYNESVRVEQARSAHKMPGDDEYESVDEEDDEEEESDPHQNAYMRKRQFIDMLSTQLETAVSIAADLDLTTEEIKQAYQAAAGDHPVPASSEECFAVAQKDEALHAYLTGLQSGGAGGAPGCPQQ